MTVAAHNPDEALARLGVPPQQPGPGALPVRCGRCDNELGWLWRGWYFSRHKGRYVVARLPAHIACERCRHGNHRAEE